MYNNEFYRRCIPENVYFDFINEYEKNLNNGFFHDGSPMTEHEKFQAFAMTFFLKMIKLKKIEVKTIHVVYLNNTINPEFRSKEDLVDAIFNGGFYHSIQTLTQKGDSDLFWKAFGISSQIGNQYMLEIEQAETGKNSILSELKKKILEIGNIDKKAILNEILPQLHKLNLDEEELYNAEGQLILTIFKFDHLIKKYQTYVNLVDEYTDSSYIVDPSLLSTFNYETYNPRLLFDIFYIHTYFEHFFDYIHNGFDQEYLNVLKIHFAISPYGYDVYQYYLDWCKKYEYSPFIEVDKPESFFLYSYSTPQLLPLYEKYFPQDNGQKAYDETINCFTKLFEELKKEKYLDEDCELPHFLWAFGLIDQYPPGFKKIAFHSKTPRGHQQGAAAFLQLLVLLGYSSDEIHQMQKEPSIINEIFDLNVTRKNKPGEGDKKNLQRIIFDSGLPIVKD